MVCGCILFLCYPIKLAFFSMVCMFGICFKMPPDILVPDFVFLLYVDNLVPLPKVRLASLLRDRLELHEAKERRPVLEVRVTLR